QGYDRGGYDVDGYNEAGYNRVGFNKKGYDIQGFDRYGFDKQGYDKEGYDKEGYTIFGFNREGFDRQGYDEHGEFRPFMDVFMQKQQLQIHQNDFYTVEWKHVLWQLAEIERQYANYQYDHLVALLQQTVDDFVVELL